MTLYGEPFYRDRHERTVHSARTLLEVVLSVLPPVRSALDLGCGVGTWLSVLRERGVEDVVGADGEWVDRSLLQIPAERFSSRDLSQPIDLGRRFDLAISLEVAEHLPAASAPTFVASLTDAADFVLFSAAIPHQGGKGHVNEQWLEYWLALFEERGYVGLDVVRPAVWEDTRIPLWYRQNVALYARRERLGELKLNAPVERLRPRSMVHPETYAAKLQRTQSVGGAWKLLRRAVQASFSRGQDR